MNQKNKYGFLLEDELLHVGLDDDRKYHLLPLSNVTAGTPAWSWTTRSPTTLAHMYLKPEDYMGLIPGRPRATYGKARPVVIITTKEGTSLYKEYRQANMPQLLPEGGYIVDTNTLTSTESRSILHLFYFPSTLIGPGYATPMQIGNTYLDVVDCETKVYECIAYASKDECLLLELGDDEVAIALAEGGPCTEKHLWVGGMPDQEYLSSIPGMVDSIVDGMNTPIENCSDSWYYHED